MSTVPRVSICIPTYCQVECLRRTLQSILRQDYHDYEIVVTDDSPDESVEALIKSMDFGGRMRFVRNIAPLGSPENWNEAVRGAKADYIKIMHHDDYFISPHSLRTFVRSLDERPDVDFGFSASRGKHAITGETRDHMIEFDQLRELVREPRASLFKGNIIGSPSATIYRRNVGQEYDSEMKWLVDVDFYMRILGRNPRVAYIPEVLVAISTNAAHRITAACENDGRVELFEYARLFAKVSPRLPRHPNVEFRWVQLFDKYGIEVPEDFARYGVEQPVPAGYFKSLLRWRRREKILLKFAPDPAIELPHFRRREPWFVRHLRRMFFLSIYLIYVRLPIPVRQLWGWAKRKCNQHRNAVE